MEHPMYIIMSETGANFHFCLTLENGKAMVTSREYLTKEQAINGIVSLQINSGSDDNYTRNKSKDGKYYFTVKARNHSEICTSEFYENEETRDIAIDYLKRICKTHRIDDLSVVRIS